MKHLKNLLQGVAVMGNVLSAPHRYTDTGSGFYRDSRNLSRDSRAVVDSFNRQIRKEYGKQKYSS